LPLNFFAGHRVGVQGLQSIGNVFEAPAAARPKIDISGGRYSQWNGPLLTAVDICPHINLAGIPSCPSKRRHCTSFLKIIDFIWSDNRFQSVEFSISGILHPPSKMNGGGQIATR